MQPTCITTSATIRQAMSTQKANRITQTQTAVEALYNSTTSTLQDSNAVITTKQAFDANGNLVRSIDARGNSTWTYYSISNSLM